MAVFHHTGDLVPQALLQGRYSIGELAGRGGMGCVYRAIDTQTENREVAIKEMGQAGLSAEQLSEAQERFRSEAEMLGQLSHPNLPAVLDSFTEGGRSYLVMDFIEGKTLLQLLSDSPKQQLDIEQVLSYAIQLCTVLDYLHQQTPPIIFRDLKPSNVMVTAEGKIFLLDFGIARHFKQGKQQDTIPLGSEGFCPPEQFGTGQTSPRSDLYSLGATLYYVLTGKNPRSNKPTLFDFAPMTQYNQQIPNELDKLIHWLVATREEQRPQSAAQVRQLLQTLEQWTVAPTSSTGGRKSKMLQFTRMNSGNFYDTRTARAAQVRQWLTSVNVLPGRAGMWCAQVLIPFLANLSSQIGAWFLLFFFPLLARLHESFAKRLRSITQRLFMQNAEQARFFEQLEQLSHSFISPIWTPYFVLLFTTLPLIIAGWSLYMVNYAHSPLPLVIFCVCLLLLLMLVGAYSSGRVRHMYSRLLLIATMLALLFPLLALLTEVRSHLLAITLSQLISVALPALALFSLLRPQQRFAWVDHFSMCVTLAAYTLLQYGFGVQELAFLGAAAQVCNTILVGILGGIALTTCLRMRRVFSWGERLLLCAVSCICSGLQYSFGLREIVHTPLITNLLQRPGFDLLNLVSLNIMLTTIPTLVTLLWLFLPQAQYSARLARVPLLVLALTAAGLLNFLGPTLSLPPLASYPLTVDLASIFTLPQVLLLTLVGGSLTLLVRLRKGFSWLDHTAILTIAGSSTLLQNSAWDNTVATLPTPTPRSGALLSSSITTLNQPQFYAAASNKLLGRSLLAVLLLTCIIVLLLLSLRLFRQIPALDALFQRYKSLWILVKRHGLRLERGLVPLMTFTCVLLYWFFGESTPWLRLWLGPFSAGKILLWLLIGATFLALFRLHKPFAAPERLILVLDALSCILLLTGGGTTEKQGLLQALYGWSGHFTIGLPPFLALPGLFVVTLLSLFWLTRPSPRWTHRVLLLLLGTVLLCLLGQALSYALVLLAVMLLLQAIVLAMQLEQ